jgi:hypothetical protein
MKKISILVLLSILIFSACKKDDTEPTNTNNNSSSSTTDNYGSIELKINNNTPNTFTVNSSGLLGDKIIIGGTKDNKDVSITVKDPSIEAGTYGSDKFGFTYGVNNIAVIASNIDTLTFVVSEHNKTTKHLKGTYNIKYNDFETGELTTASGSFDVDYIIIL